MQRQQRISYQKVYRTITLSIVWPPPSQICRIHQIGLGEGGGRRSEGRWWRAADGGRNGDVRAVARRRCTRWQISSDSVKYQVRIWVVWGDLLLMTAEMVGGRER
jgi:hypothetical protein